MSEKKKDPWLDKARALSEINETDISLLTWLIYHEDSNDIEYRPKQELNSFIEHQNNHQI